MNPTYTSENNIAPESESVIVRIAERYCGGNKDIALELIDEVVTVFSGSKTHCQLNEDHLKALNTLHKNAWKFLIEYQTNQFHKNEKRMADMVRMSTRAMALELGFKTAAGADNSVELGRKTHFDKQAVNKCMSTFQKLLNLPKRDEQRSDDARKNMSDARKKQIV